MVEIIEKHYETKIEKLGEKFLENQEKEKAKIAKIRERVSNAQSFLGYMQGCKAVSKNDKNTELYTLFDELIKKYHEFNKRSKTMIEIEIVEGWKGNDSIDIYKGFENDFIIKSHNKDKETGEISTITHQIPHENVNRLLFWIKEWNVGESHKCYDFALKLNYPDWKSLWKERDLYFQEYYFPVKVLEALKIVSYSGRGIVTRLK